MNKTDMADALSLSCVENYFLAFFQNHFDERGLYCASFRQLGVVLRDFCFGHARYEQYGGVKRIQDLAETLGLTKHSLSDKLNLSGPGELTLIRVNERFFDGAKLLPWRTDHFIYVFREDGQIRYFNHYPLSGGTMTEERLCEIYDGCTLSFRLAGAADESRQDKYCRAQLDAMTDAGETGIGLTAHNLQGVRNACGILKVLRRRTAQWLRLMGERGLIAYDEALASALAAQIGLYDKLFLAIELQTARARIDPVGFEKKTEELFQTEQALAQMMKERRIK